MKKRRNRGNTRPEKDDASTVKMQIRVTPEERDDWTAIAQYRGMRGISAYVRWLVITDRAELIAKGKRLPRR